MPIANTVPRFTETGVVDGITIMVDVATMPANSFGYVPTPAIVAPIEFTLRQEDYAALVCLDVGDAGVDRARHQ